MNDVRRFLNELVLRDRPRAVLLYEGDNDAVLGAEREQVLAHFDAIVAGIHKRLPTAHLHPVGRSEHRLLQIV